MAIRTELNLRLQNTPGALGRVCQVLADEHVNILALALESTGALRLILEPATARLAAGKVDARRLEKLDAICRKGYTPGDPASTLRFLEANREFHLQVAESGGNQRFVRLLTQILDETTRVMHIGLALRNRNAEMQHEHHALLEALQKNDGEAAAQIAEQQVAASRDMVLSGLINSNALLDQPIA